MLINEVVKDNTPDYEVFDTLYLALTVKDINQEVGTGTASGKKNAEFFNLESSQRHAFEKEIHFFLYFLKYTTTYYYRIFSILT